MTSTNIEKTILKYENFVNNVLKEDLRILEQRLLKVNSEITDLIQQKHTLKVVTDVSLHPDGFKTQVNIGSNFFMEAAVHDTSKLLYYIGLNHYLEFTVPEANKYLDALIKAYETQAKEILSKSLETKAHIKMVLMGLHDLTNDNNNDVNKNR